jgi:hypothetical protein
MADREKKPQSARKDGPLAAAKSVSGYGEQRCDQVCIQGTVAIEGSPPGRKGDPLPPPVRIESTGTIKVESMGPLEVQLQKASVAGSDDQALWVAIRDRTRAIGFDNYSRFIHAVLCTDVDSDTENPERNHIRQERNRVSLDRLGLGVDAYQLLKTATEAFLILRCGVFIDKDTYAPVQEEEQGRLGKSYDADQIAKKLDGYLGRSVADAGVLPYLRQVLGDELESVGDNPFCGTLLSHSALDPCLLELIWSYWHEEGLLAQALNAISLRFQNKRPSDRNPMTQLELSPLRPLSNLLWGYVQDEPFRLTVARRAYEYSHHYGLNLVGKAVPAMRPADNRSKFLEAFHSLLRQAAIFYKEDSDTTVIADGFPLSNGLQEVHMLLAEGAHNQFRDLPWTARVEMLIQQWLLSRQEMREFLRGRQMVPYKELWMGQADTVRRLLGWGDTSVSHFRDLGVYGEQILLSIRYGAWVSVNNQNQAKSWVRYWKPEIQGYIHAYRAVTGIDLGAGDQILQQVDATLPSVLLQRRTGSGTA